jgi:hypothetical protein
MDSDQRPGLWQDVYRPVYEGRQVYVKLQIHQDAQVISNTDFLKEAIERAADPGSACGRA